MQKFRQGYLRKIPGVTVILQEAEIISLIEEFSHPVVVETINQVTNELRQLILASENQAELEQIDVSMGNLINKVKTQLVATWSPKLKQVINATGVVLHTNLGRALLSKAAVEAVYSVSANYANLELNLETGKRGSRYEHVEDLICRLTGAEAALVVNNNAAAVLLVLSTIAQGKEVVVSRGQLVEIGGSFRIPEVMKQSGAILVEVGATNKTHLRDYRQAITENTAALLRVHTSNYRIIGFTQDVALTEMVELAAQHNLPVLDDLGSGVLIDLQKYGLPAEPTVQASIAAGADIVTFSGDKLLGGPQAGIIAGKAEYIEKIKRNQLNRALRIDKMTLAALEATLRLYLDEVKAVEKIPTLHMLTLKAADLVERATEFAHRVNLELGQWYTATVEDGMSQVGGGSFPEVDLPTKLVRIEPKNCSKPTLEQWLRKAKVPVLARIYHDQLLFDFRTIQAEEETLLLQSLEWVGEQLTKEVKA